MRRRPRDWEVVVEFQGETVERHEGLTRLRARMAAHGLNLTFARGRRVVQRGGLFTAPTYAKDPMPFAIARQRAEVRDDE